MKKPRVIVSLRRIPMQSPNYNSYRGLLSMIISFTVLFFLLCSCVKGDTVKSKVSPGWVSAKTGIRRPINKIDEEYREYLIEAEHNKGKRILDAIYELANFPTEELLEETSLVVRGTVIGYDYLTVSSAYSEEMSLYTDYYLDIRETFRGVPETDGSGLIRVRTLGGENDEIIITNDELLLEIGKEYLFFLISPGGNSNANEYGYYYPYALSAGVYAASDETVTSGKNEIVPRSFTAHTRYSVDNKEIEYLPFVELVSEYNESHPVDVEAAANLIKEKLLTALESGYLTREKYDRIMAEMEKYTTVVE